MAARPVPDDVSLVARAAAGEERALVDLYRRFGAAVYALANKITGSREAAEEVTQDVFERVWRGAAGYRAEQAPVYAWVLGIARNRSIDEARRSGRRPATYLGAWEESLTTGPESDPSDAAHRSLERDRVRAALAKLPGEQRRALELAYFGGLSHGKIARATGQPVGTVKTRIRLALHKMRAALDEGGDR